MKLKQLRYLRFRIACLMEGPGASLRLSADWNVDREYMLRVLKGAPRKDRVAHKCFSSARIEALADEFTRRQFQKHKHVFQEES
jgi:hypothetical protein